MTPASLIFKALPYILLVGLFFGGLYYIYGLGRKAEIKKIDKQTERIVKKRDKTDEKVHSLPDDAVRAGLRRWMLNNPGSSD